MIQRVNKEYQLSAAQSMLTFNLDCVLKAGEKPVDCSSRKKRSLHEDINIGVKFEIKPRKKENFIETDQNIAIASNFATFSTLLFCITIF